MRHCDMIWHKCDQQREFRANERARRIASDRAFIANWRGRLCTRGGPFRMARVLPKGERTRFVRRASRNALFGKWHEFVLQVA